MGVLLGVGLALGLLMGYIISLRHKEGEEGEGLLGLHKAEVSASSRQGSYTTSSEREREDGRRVSETSQTKKSESRKSQSFTEGDPRFDSFPRFERLRNGGGGGGVFGGEDYEEESSGHLSRVESRSALPYGSSPRTSSYDTYDTVSNESEEGACGQQLPLLLRPGSVLAINPKQVEIGQRFAAGGSGQCLYGRFAGTDVVLKELYAQITDHTSFDEFLNEALMLARLTHPHIVRFFGTVVTRSQPPSLFLVIERCRENLGTVIARKGVSAKQWLPYAQQICQTMEFLHGRSIVHRDIKPENILLADDHNLKICDLGLARIQPPDARVSMTCEGTFAFMPPEVMSAIRVVAYDGKKWDVYSTAVLLLSMWTNEAPYADLTPAQIIAGVSNAGHLRPLIPEGIPTPVVQLITSMWSQEPDARPGFGEIVATLEGGDMKDVAEGSLSTKDMLRGARFRKA